MISSSYSLMKSISTNSNLLLKYASIRKTCRWHLVSAVCVQRRPLITPELNWLEKKMKLVLQKIEVNNSLYSNHEMRHFEDLYVFKMRTC